MVVNMKLINNLLEKWKIELVIFDLDGTLVNTLDKHIEAFMLLFKEIKQQIPREQIAENMGRTPKDTLLTLLPKLKNDKTRLEILANRKEEILTTLLVEIPKLPGSLETVNYLKNESLKLGLASSTPLFNVRKMIDKAGFGESFDVIITGEDIVIGKPNPEVFLKASQKAGVKRESCLVIGDSPHDIEAAKNAQMKIIAVGTGEHTIEQIKSAQPDLVIKSLTELLTDTK
ncbi:MAG: HAD family phosphatase [Asgard group archaeon]|nr:HAD family phosphatase [Asgard group archaeon]